MKKIVISISVIVIIIAAVIIINGRKSQETYTTAKVERGDIVSEVVASGTLNPVVNVTVGAQVSGKLVKIFVDYNSHVVKGQLLALIDPSTYQANAAQAQAEVDNNHSSVLVAEANVHNVAASVAQAEHALEAAHAQLARDKANLENASLNFKRMATLAQRNLVAQSDADSAKYAHQAAQATVAADKSQIQEAEAKLSATRVQLQVAGQQVQSSMAIKSKAEAQLKLALTNLNYTKILSPVEGTVVARNVDVGQTVVSSFQAPSLFVIAQDLKKMQIDTQVDEASVGKIKTGQKVKFNVAAFPDKDFKGLVSQVRINPIVQQNVVNYDVVVAVANPDLSLLPGMTATVTFLLAEHTGVLKIPNQALRFVPKNGNGVKAMNSASSNGSKPQQTTKIKKAPHVWVLKGGKPERHDVTLGLANETEAEVQSGLQEGDEVITASEAQPTNTNPFMPRRPR